MDPALLASPPGLTLWNPLLAFCSLCLGRPCSSSCPSEPQLKRRGSRVKPSSDPRGCVHVPKLGRLREQAGHMEEGSGWNIE